MPVVNPILNEAKNNEPSSTPAAPAIIPETAKVSVVARSTLMPMSRAALGSCAAACIAIPRRVKWKNSMSAPIISALKNDDPDELRRHDEACKNQTF